MMRLRFRMNDVAVKTLEFVIVNILPLIGNPPPAITSTAVPMLPRPIALWALSRRICGGFRGNIAHIFFLYQFTDIK